MIFEANRLAPLTQIRLVFQGGGLTEPADLPGLAAFTAKCWLRGTQKKSEREWTRAVEALGWSISVSVDASQTSICATGLSESWDRFLVLLDEAFFEPGFREEEIETLRTMIEAEILASVQDPQNLVSRAVLARFSGDPRWGWPTAGRLDSLEKFTREMVVDHFKKMFCKNQLSVGALSDLPVKEIEDRLRPILEKIPAQPGTLLRTYPEWKVEKPQVAWIHRESLSTTPFYFAVPGLADSDPQFLGLEIGNFAFGSEFTSRLMQSLRAKNGWTYGASSGFFQLLGPKQWPGIFSTYSFPSVEFAHLAVEETYRLFEEFVSKGITEDEFNTAIKSLSNRYAFESDTAEKRLTLRLREKISGRPYRSPSQYQKELESWGLARVNEAIKKQFSQESWVLSGVGDEKLWKRLPQSLLGLAEVVLMDIDEETALFCESPSRD